eukprot:7168663-Ditylum_brightwellii.AAC.1
MMSSKQNQVTLMSFQNEQHMAIISKFQVSSCSKTTLDIIESGLVEDNEDMELNCLLLKCNKMLSDMWQWQEPMEQCQWQKGRTAALTL